MGLCVASSRPLPVGALAVLLQIFIVIPFGDGTLIFVCMLASTEKDEGLWGLGACPQRLHPAWWLRVALG